MNNEIGFPTWLGNIKKVIYLKDGTYIKGIMEWNFRQFHLVFLATSS
jgi:hypothetical protein